MGLVYLMGEKPIRMIYAQAYLILNRPSPYCRHVTRNRRRPPERVSLCYYSFFSLFCPYITVLEYTPLIYLFLQNRKTKQVALPSRSVLSIALRGSWQESIALWGSWIPPFLGVGGWGGVVNGEEVGHV